MIKVRFHLGAGKNYKHWQVKQGDSVSYYDPGEVQLVLIDCSLINNLKTAQKVHSSGVKDVCGWISCRSVDVRFSNDVDVSGKVRVWFNPIDDIHWRIGPSKPWEGDNIADNMKFNALVTLNNRVYVY